MAFPFGKLVEHEQKLAVTNIKDFRKMLSIVASFKFSSKENPWIY